MLNRKNLFIIPLFLLFLFHLLFISGCEIIDIPDIEGMVADLVDVLEGYPDDWEETFENTILQIEESGGNLSEEVAEDLTQVLEETRVMIQTTIFCSIDFSIDRATERIQEIQYSYWPEKYSPPLYNPVICGTIPEQIIDFNTTYARYSGYNFLNYKGKFTANIEYESGFIVRGNLPILPKTDYELTIDLQAVNWGDLNLDPEQSPRLSLHWDEGDSEILIIVEQIEPVKPEVEYKAHVAGIGWLGWVPEGEVAGTTGESRQMEAVIINLIEGASDGVGIRYQAHVSNLGWLGWVNSNEIAGTIGQKRAMQAIQIELMNAPPGYSVFYQAHVAGYGWMGWVKDGEIAGTVNQSRIMEALKIVIATEIPNN